MGELDPKLQAALDEMAKCNERMAELTRQVRELWKGNPLHADRLPLNTLVDIRPGPPRSLAEALTFPLPKRAQLVLANPHVADYVQCQRWPEIEQTAAQFAQLTGTSAGLSAYSRDAGVRALVALFADVITLEDLEQLLPRLVKTDWWRASRRGLSSLTPEVIRRAQIVDREEAEARARAARREQNSARLRTQPTETPRAFDAAEIDRQIERAKKAMDGL